MSKDKYNDLDLNKIISEIGNSWTSKEDNIIKKATTADKLSKAGKGFVMSEEHKALRSLAMKGKTKSEEHKKKISITNTGFKLSKETRAKMSLAKKGIPIKRKI